MIYAFTQIDSLSMADLAGLWPLLSEQRKALVDRFKFFRHRRQSAMAYILLRYALIHEVGIRNKVEFEFGPHGKPFLKDYPGIHFNLSHCPVGVICSISDSPVGVDIAQVTTENLECAETAMHINERREIVKSADDARTFARFWSLKESYLKFLGRGIGNDIASLDFSGSMEDRFVFDGCCMQVWNSPDSVISYCGKRPQHMHYLTKGNLFDILLGETKHEYFAYA